MQGRSRLALCAEFDMLINDHADEEAGRLCLNSPAGAFHARCASSRAAYVHRRKYPCIRALLILSLPRCRHANLSPSPGRWFRSVLDLPPFRGDFLEPIVPTVIFVPLSVGACYR